MGERSGDNARDKGGRREVGRERETGRNWLRVRRDAG